MDIRYNNDYSTKSLLSDNYSTTTRNNLSNTTASPDSDSSSSYSLAFIIIVGSVMVVLSLVTILGNLMVLVSFYIDKKIREPSNYFIFSLALSDFAIGLEGFPLYTIYVLSGPKWTMGAFMCDLWLAIDYAVCLASIYTVLFITIDRYCSVKIPTAYRNWRTKRKVKIIVVGIWIIPTLLFFISVFGWEHFSGKGRTLAEHECEVQFMKDNPYFNMSMYISYYWSTLVVMIFLYAGIYEAAKRLQTKSQQKQRRLTAVAAMRASVAFTPFNAMVGTGAPDGGGGVTTTDDDTIVNKNYTDTQQSELKPSDDSAVCVSSPAHKFSLKSHFVFKENKDVSKSSSGHSSADFNRNTDTPEHSKPTDYGNINELDASDSSPIVKNGNKFNSNRKNENKRYIDPYRLTSSAKEAFRTFYLKTSNSVLKFVPQKSFIKSPLDGIMTTKSKSMCVENPLKFPLREPYSCPQLEKIFEEDLPDIYEKTWDNKTDGSADCGETIENETSNVADKNSSSSTLKQPVELASSNSSGYPASSLEISPRDSAMNYSGPMFESECYGLIGHGATLKKVDAVLFRKSGAAPFFSLLKDLYDDSSETEEESIGGLVGLAIQQAASNMCTLVPVEDNTSFLAVEENDELKPLSPISPVSSKCSAEQAKKSRQVSISSTLQTHLAHTLIQPNKPTTPLLPKAVSFDRGSEIDEDDDSSLGRKESIDERSLDKGNFRTPTTSFLLQTGGKGYGSQNNNSSEEESRSSKFISLFRRRRSSSKMYKKSKSENRARKALRTITFILGAFVLFWTPFYVVATIYGFCTQCIPDWVLITSYYMCYMNSPINPFCYAMANAQFKKTFARMLHGDFHRT